MKRIVVYLIFVLAVAEVLLVFVSWLLSATMTDGVQSLISSAGVRWFFGSFVTLLSKPLLVWLLLLSMAGGCFWQSGMLRTASDGYRQRLAKNMTVVLLLVLIGIVLLLIAVPHALLLSATGRIFPSPFSRSLVPVIAFSVISLSTIYGWITGRFATFTMLVDALCYGIRMAAPVFILYVLIMQLYESLRFVFLC